MQRGSFYNAKRVCQKFKQHAPKGQKHIAQGNTLGENAQTIKRPVRAKALIINAFALTGRLGYYLSVHPGRMPWAMSLLGFQPV